MSEVSEAPLRADANGDSCQATGSFIWYELMTPDPEGAKAFYEPVVGWSMTTGHDGDQDYGFITRTDGGMSGGVLRLTDEMGGHGAGSCWLGYLAVDDVDSAVREIESSGGKCLMPARDIEMAGRIAMVADPAGAPFYVMKPRPPESREEADTRVFSVDQPQRVGWNELSTSDPAAARKFYTGLFGWDSDEFMDMGELGEYRFLEQDGTRFGALCGVMPGQQPRWRYYVRVPSIAKAKAAAEKHGGTIAIGPHQVPTGDYIIIGFDPQGAEFALVGGE